MFLLQKFSPFTVWQLLDMNTSLFLFSWYTSQKGLLWIRKWVILTRGLLVVFHFLLEPMFRNRFMHFLKSVHTFRRKSPFDRLFWQAKQASLTARISLRGMHFARASMGGSCFHALRLRRFKSKPLPEPSSSSKTLLDSDLENMERRRFDSLESWSMILDSENVETWEASKEDQEEWTADLSQLFIGNKFASGAHSRIYRGIYKQRAVAVKMARIPTQDEERRGLLEQQFKSEVALLSRLFHPNIVQVIKLFNSTPLNC